MKLVLLSMIVLAMVQICHAADLEDGLYWQTDGKSGTKVVTQSGREVFVGGKWGVAPLEVSIRSQDNGNARFDVQIKVAYDTRISEANLGTVMMCGGQSFAMAGGGSQGKEASFTGFNVQGQESADHVAKYFGAPVRSRRHPGYAFRTTFITEKESYNPGDEVVATLRIENVSDQTITFQKGGHNRAERDTQFRFMAHLNFKGVPDVGSDLNFGGLSVKRTLKPHEIFEDKIVLNKWFAFKDPGSYVILGSYLMQFHEPEDKQYFVTWEDFVTAEFYVTVKTPPANAEK